MVTIHRCTISFWLYRPVIQCGRSKTGRSTRNWSNWSIWVRIARNTFVAITEKNKEQYVRLQLSITGTQGEFSPVLLVLLITQQSFWVSSVKMKMLFPVDHSKQMMQMIYIQTIPNESWCEAYMMYAVCGTNFVYRVFLS